ncbi:MAG: hypothetical protein GY820_00515 [Gammaproteobacteria bacterium]|nr:hypothetical protein [Gammaproteobacteria bacterium]
MNRQEKNHVTGRKHEKSCYFASLREHSFLPKPNPKPKPNPRLARHDHLRALRARSKKA